MGSASSLFYMRSMNAVKKALETYSPVGDTLVIHCLTHLPELCFFECVPFSHTYDVKEALKKADSKALFGFYRSAPNKKALILVTYPGPLSNFLNRELSFRKMLASQQLGATISTLWTSSLASAPSTRTSWPEPKKLLLKTSTPCSSPTANERSSSFSRKVRSHPPTHSSSRNR